MFHRYMHRAVQAVRSVICGVLSSLCTCGRRRGETRTAARSATCSWPTTNGTPRRGGRARRSSTTSAARTSSTPGCGPAAGRRAVPAPGARGGRWPRGAGPGVHRVPAAGRHARPGRLWRRLGMDQAMQGSLRAAGSDPAAERVLFALVANRALAAVLQARRRRVGRVRTCTSTGSARRRRRVLPGDGLAAGDRGGPGEAGVRPGRRTC